MYNFIKFEKFSLQRYSKNNICDVTNVTVKKEFSLITRDGHVIYFSHSDFRFWYSNTLLLSEMIDKK